MLMVVLQPGATEDQVGRVRSEIEILGGHTRVLRAGGKPLIHVLNGKAGTFQRLRKFPGVQAVVPLPSRQAQTAPQPFFPYHFLGLVAAGIPILGALTFLSGFLPPGLAGRPADPVQAAPHLVPWYLGALHALLEWLDGAPSWLGPLLLAGLLVLILFLPEADARLARLFGNRRPLLWAGFALAAAFFLFALFSLLGGAA